ncbi:peptidoglycan-recognition protein SC2-like isoform X2 [Rhynchophorus ferrugineus]|uniref:peptidoglycan-recognition protein SC2-like isoform X2 n=1 Tax=Rhynchophorus ferrugineus TaxID=354439 RepID=UPI003FCEC43E
MGHTCPSIINRAEWGARPALSTTTLTKNPAPYVVIHHSDTPSCLTFTACKQRLQNIQEHHMSVNGWEDIGYNFVIGSEGTVFEGRGWGLKGSHAKPYNARSIGICLMGKLQDNNPTAAQLMALESLIECGVEKGKITTGYRLIGHRQATKTACPGDKMFRILKNMPNFEPKPR